MALYSYVKKKSSFTRNIAKIFSLVCIFSGIALLSFVLYPIVAFELFYAPKFNGVVSPLPRDIKDTVIERLPHAFGAENIDYTKASVWFPKAVGLQRPRNTSSFYTLSIPKVGIQNANVAIGGDDLAKSLIHFTGPLPGSNGNPVILGHSTLLWFYNPKDYKSIFSRLPDLSKNDDIFVTVDSITYRYQVIDMKVVYPDDLSVLEQRNDDSYITLITCVPQGTYLKRLIVLGKLVAI